jgi:hypothetical protein
LIAEFFGRSVIVAGDWRLPAMSRHRLSLPSAQHSFLDYDLCLAIINSEYVDEDETRPTKRRKIEPGWAPILEFNIDCHFSDATPSSCPTDAASVCTLPVSMTVGFDDPVLTIFGPICGRPLFSFVCEETTADTLLKLRWLQTLRDKDPSVGLCMRLVSSAAFHVQGTHFEMARVAIRSDIRFDQTLDRFVKLSLKDRLAFLDYAFPNPSKEITADDFYTHIGTIPKDFILDPSEDRRMQHHAIACRLYPFQKRAVSWMLQREGAIPFRPSYPGDTQLQFTPLWESVKDLDENELYLNRHQGFTSPDHAWIRSTFEAQPIRGGILAEVLTTVHQLAFFSRRSRRWASVRPSR